MLNSQKENTMYFSKEQISSLKQTPIASYLDSLGIQPVKEANGQLLYHSPLTNENSPSFYVHPAKNVFNCFSSGEKGDVIRLITLLEKLAFNTALERLSSFDPACSKSFTFGGRNAPNLPPMTPKSSKLILVDDKGMFGPMLTNYIISRAIPMVIANQYLQAIRYQNGRYEYQAVGLRSDKGSYALRAKRFKGWLGQSAIRTITIAGSSEINLFEGFFDFLSALTYYKRLKPTCTTVVLNSTSNLTQALSMLKSAKSINCYLDNDAAGHSTLNKLIKLELPVTDRSTVYREYKDFNEMIRNSTV
ncbi:toprim domain-containing protein [Spirosoma sp. KNUC1025]|uniref:toprim domain-containing protein n=1 Tax=Spirosoma sp. KNUC1025 TaxID=2894082 RepID=UPI00386CF44E|nr:CHC2 zinc finger domain-containing protein [Spirosoma sp. KNUC1025]